MTSSSAAPRPHAPVLADLVRWAWVRDVVLVGLFTVALAASAQILIPLPGTPVPVTAQTFVVLLGAAALGPVRAGVGASAFFAVGALGVPWFAVSSGVTLGYIAGFVVAAVLVGRLARAGWTGTVRGAAGAMVLGNLVIYAVGATVLALVLQVGPAEALGLGVVPFLLGDAAKVAVATLVLPFVQRAVENADV
jgi:biotin transport system substrate-specific component